MRIGQPFMRTAATTDLAWPGTEKSGWNQKRGSAFFANKDHEDGYSREIRSLDNESMAQTGRG